MTRLLRSAPWLVVLAALALRPVAAPFGLAPAAAAA